MVYPFVDASTVSSPTRTLLRCAVAVLAMVSAFPAISHSQTTDAPPAQKVAPKRTKPATPSDAQTAPPAVVKRDPATAQATIEASAKLLEAGKIDQAVSSLTSAISGGNLPPAIMARALYLRGSAYRKQSKAGLAISDLTSSLWLKGGLNDADRADAVLQRTAAYSEAGLGEQGQSNTTPATSTRKRTDTAAAEAPSASGASGGFFGSLFGSNSTSATTDPQAQAAPKALRPQPPAAPPAAAPTAAGPPPARIAAATVAAVQPPAGSPTGAPALSRAFQSRIALVKTRGEADAVATKLKTQHNAALAGRTPTIGEASFGSMGTFFQVRVGPFSSAAEAGALCGRLKGSGLDCVAVNN